MVTKKTINNKQNILQKVRKNIKAINEYKTIKDYENNGYFPLYHLECLAEDIENLLKLANKRKNKDKLDIILNAAYEDILYHFTELSYILNKTNTLKSLLTKKEYEELFGKVF
ncbi:MAG: hypothetical protein QW478_05205 [Candidatus Micrarchaeaceae archaeon]